MSTWCSFFSSVKCFCDLILTSDMTCCCCRSSFPLSEFCHEMCLFRNKRKSYFFTLYIADCQNVQKLRQEFHLWDDCFRKLCGDTKKKKWIISFHRLNKIQSRSVETCYNTSLRKNKFIFLSILLYLRNASTLVRGSFRSCPSFH
jgi:hypothetical protein